MLLSLKLTSAYPSMASPDREQTSAATPTVTLNMVTIDRTISTLDHLKVLTWDSLNKTIAGLNMDADNLMTIMSMIQTHRMPEIPDSVVTEAELCQNLQNVLIVTEGVVDTYITLVRGIPVYLFDFTILSNRLQSIQTKIFRLLGTSSQQAYPNTQIVTPRDYLYTLQTLVALKAQTETMTTIFKSLKACAK